MTYSSSRTATTIGVDGCRCGWIAIGIINGRVQLPETFSTMDRLWNKHRSVDLILIDIPIGLPDRERPARTCDLQARQLLRRPRSSSVFSPPGRAALDAATHADATRLNRKETGKGLSIQSWGIQKKVREVDLFLDKMKSARQKIREVHPEVLFWAMNSKRPMQHGKKNSEGRQERIKVLQDHFPDVEDYLDRASSRYRRRDVQKDDILDALAAAISGQYALKAVSDPKERDQRGLLVEIVYPEILEPVKIRMERH